MGDVITRGSWGAKGGDSKRSTDDTGNGNPPGGGELEARVAKLESHVEYIRSDVNTLKSDVKTIAGDIVEIKVGAVSLDSRLKNIEQNMVTKGQLAIWALLMVLAGAGAVVGGGWWIVQQYLSPILKALPK